MAERIIHSDGDLRPDIPLAGAEERGLFVKRIEQALLAGDADLAVHSLKDLPTRQPDGLRIAAVPVRHDPRDALVSRDGWTLETLPPGTAVATGSFRRRAQILHRRPDLRVVPVRGNVDSRVRKLTEGAFGALVLAVAGVERLGIEGVEIRPLDLRDMLPAVGQGALALEIREGDSGLHDIVRALDHEASHTAVAGERAFLRRLGGGCLAPATGFAREVDGVLRIDAVVGSPDGEVLLGDGESGPAEHAEAIGVRLAERLLCAGAGRLLDLARRAVDAG